MTEAVTAAWHGGEARQRPLYRLALGNGNSHPVARNRRTRPRTRSVASTIARCRSRPRTISRNDISSPSTRYPSRIAVTGMSSDHQHDIGRARAPQYLKENDVGQRRRQGREPQHRQPRRSARDRQSPWLFDDRARQLSSSGWMPAVETLRWPAAANPTVDAARTAPPVHSMNAPARQSRMPMPWPLPKSRLCPRRMMTPIRPVTMPAIRRAYSFSSPAAAITIEGEQGRRGVQDRGKPARNVGLPRDDATKTAAHC